MIVGRSSMYYSCNPRSGAVPEYKNTLGNNKFKEIHCAAFRVNVYVHAFNASIRCE